MVKNVAIKQVKVNLLRDRRNLGEMCVCVDKGQQSSVGEYFFWKWKTCTGQGNFQVVLLPV